MTKNDRLKFCLKWIEKLNGQYSDLDNDRAEAIRFCNGDPTIVEVVKGRSQVVTTDMQDAIDMAKPDILETIAGIDEPMKLEPSSSEDVEPVKKLQILGNVMLRRKNPWYRLCADFLDESMKLKFGAFKYAWESKKKTIGKLYENLDDLEIQAKLAIPDTSLGKDEIDRETGKRQTTINYSTVDEYVKIDTVPADRIKFPLDTRDFADAAFVVEETRLYRHEVIQQYGKKTLKKIEEYTGTFKAVNDSRVDEERFKDLGGIHFMIDDDKKYRIYECYFFEEDEEKPWIFTFCGEEVLTDEENTYGKPPYRGGSPFMLAHRLIGKGYIDYLKEIQRQRTFLKRQIFDNVTMANYRRYFVDPERMNLDDYLNNNITNGLVRVTGDPKTVVKGEEKAPLPPEVLTFWEMMNVEKDYHSPTPRSYEGVNPDVLNKTYRGQAQQIGQASKKLLMMIRGYMEDVFVGLFSDVIDCILRYMQRSTSIRYLNEDVEVTPDNIIGKYDLVVNVGLGTNDKNDVIAKLQQLMGLMIQFQARGSRVVTDQNIYYTFTELIKAMGFLNTSDFVTDPKLQETVMQFIQTIMQMLQEMSAIPEYAQVAQLMGSQIQPLAQQVLSVFGVQPQATPQSGGANSEGTFPGQNTAELPQLPNNPNEPRETIDGGGYFA